MALVAGGVALTTLGALADAGAILDVIAAFSCIAGAVLAIGALWSWRRAERALRMQQPLPAPAMLPVLVTGIAVIGLAMAAYAVLQVL